MSSVLSGKPKVLKKRKQEGAHKGRPVNLDLHQRVSELLKAGIGIRAAVRHAGCSTIAVLKIRSQMEDLPYFSVMGNAQVTRRRSPTARRHSPLAGPAFHAHRRERGRPHHRRG